MLQLLLKCKQVTIFYSYLQKLTWIHSPCLCFVLLGSSGLQAYKIAMHKALVSTRVYVYTQISLKQYMWHAVTDLEFWK